MWMGSCFWTKNMRDLFWGSWRLFLSGDTPLSCSTPSTGYPRTLEFSVVDSHRSVEHMQVIAETYGPDVGVWRYDPILVSSETPIDFHRRNFSTLARSLEGYTDEVVVSFAQVYRKTLRNLDWAADEFGFSWEDPFRRNQVANWRRKWLPLLWPTVCVCACAPKTSTWQKA